MELNNLLEKDVFEVVFFLRLFKNIRIFNCYFIDEIINIETADTIKKLRLVIIVYNNYNNTLILI